ncbi:DUF2254 domain-containing protein [Streptomyces sp. ID01-15D]|uniref:DUF2254 domain-containing protein n=2 Tax=unclassified Streptomyces TaxID=2593676 RepID=UPI0029A8EF7F|nr:DUF2254 domain-containing protein [Streptomyces sp. ID01-15D]MDX3736548.1 DUF2254 domain-containing protein [Streptomyces sp. ID01-15D]
MSDRGYRRPRPLSPLREHLRDTFWFAPTMGFVSVFVLWFVATELDDAIVRLLQREEAYEELGDLIGFSQDTRTVVTAVSSAMMTFIGVVFSISLVAVQMASGQLTPRVVRIFVRSRISKLTMTVFLATFLVSLLVLSSYESATLRLMQVGPVVDRIARDSFRVLGRMPRAGGAQGDDEAGPETARLVYEGRAGVLRDVNTARLVRAARRQGVVLRVIPRIGDFVVPGTPMLAVHGGAVEPRLRLRSAVSVSVERTLHQDLAFGLRQLADIALRALSTSVNDPTTAVQCLDRIVQILAVVVRLPLGKVHHRDRAGRVRLVQEGPEWADLVDLAFEEIRWCVAGSPQVTRRLMAGLGDLLLLAPEERQQPLVRHRELLVQTVERAVPVAADRAFALLPDRQGIG